MLRELIQFLKGTNQDESLAGNLDRMIQESAELVHLAGDAYFHRTPETPAYGDLKARDKGINQLQHQIRKDALVEAVAATRPFNLPFYLSLMNIVKDLERLGDYAKDLAGLQDHAGPAADPDYQSLAREAEELVQALSPVMKAADQLKAVELIEAGKDIRRDLTAIQRRLLKGDENLSWSPADILALHYYIRIISHTLNVLSTLVTPLHHMDSLGRKHLLPEVREKLRALPS